MADKVLEEVTKMDRSSMNKVQTEEKTVLPDAEGKLWTFARSKTKWQILPKFMPNLPN